MLSSGAVVPENRPADAEVKIGDWIPFSVEGDERNPQGVKLISSPSGTGLSAKLDSRVWDNQQYHIVRVVRYPNGNGVTCSRTKF